MLTDEDTITKDSTAREKMVRYICPRGNQYIVRKDMHKFFESERKVDEKWKKEEYLLDD